MNAIRQFIHDPLLGPIILLTLLPMSFSWSAESGFTWMFWSDDLMWLAIVLRIGAGVCVGIAGFRTWNHVRAR